MLGGVYVYHCKQWIVYRITESICCPPKNDYNVLLIMLQLKKKTVQGELRQVIMTMRTTEAMKMPYCKETV